MKPSSVSKGGVMINPIRKKTKIHAERMGLVDMANKVDELVKEHNNVLDLLQAREEASKGECDLTQSRHCKKDGRAYLLDEKCPCFKDWMVSRVSNTYRAIPLPYPLESKRVCKHEDTSIDRCEDCGKKRNPPEHKDEWKPIRTLLFQVLKPKEIDILVNQIKEIAVSKEKIKLVIKQNEGIDTNLKGTGWVRIKDLFNSLGLGD